MDENILELLEEWDDALRYEDKIGERKAGRKIDVLRKEYREKGNISKRVKVVGVFSGSLCKIYCNDLRIATIFDLRYTGAGSDFDDTRMYKNDDTFIWLDYAVYE